MNEWLPYKDLDLNTCKFAFPNENHVCPNAYAAPHNHPFNISFLSRTTTELKLYLPGYSATPGEEAPWRVTSHRTLLLTNHIYEKSLNCFLTIANTFHKVKETTQLKKKA